MPHIEAGPLVAKEYCNQGPRMKVSKAVSAQLKLLPSHNISELLNGGIKLFWNREVHGGIGSCNFIHVTSQTRRNHILHQILTLSALDFCEGFFHGTIFSILCKAHLICVLQNILVFATSFHFM